MRRDKSNILSSIWDKLTKKVQMQDYIDAFFDAITKKITFQEYLDATSDYVDEQILEIRRKEGLKFVAGNCFLNCPEPFENIAIKVELYFKDSEDKWIKKVLNGTAKTAVFEPKSIQDIESLKKQEMKIAINPPADQKTE